MIEIAFTFFVGQLISYELLGDGHCAHDDQTVQM